MYHTRKAMNEQLAKIQSIYETMHDRLASRLYDIPSLETHILVCHGPGCFSNHSEQCMTV